MPGGFQCNLTLEQGCSTERTRAQRGSP